MSSTVGNWFAFRAALVILAAGCSRLDISTRLARLQLSAVSPHVTHMRQRCGVQGMGDALRQAGGLHACMHAALFVRLFMGAHSLQPVASTSMQGSAALASVHASTWNRLPLKDNSGTPQQKHCSTHAQHSMQALA